MIYNYPLPNANDDPLIFTLDYNVILNLVKYFILPRNDKCDELHY